MSYTIVDDDGVFQVRAEIRSLAEMDEFLNKLANAQKKLIDREKPKQENPHD